MVRILHAEPAAERILAPVAHESVIMSSHVHVAGASASTFNSVAMDVSSGAAQGADPFNWIVVPRSPTLPCRLRAREPLC